MAGSLAGSGDESGVGTVSTGGGGSTSASGGGGGSQVSITPPGGGVTGGAGTGIYQVVRGTPDRVEYGPPRRISTGDIVTVTPIGTNANAVQVSTQSPDAAKFGPYILMSPTANPRQLRVRNLNEIGMYTTHIGEGITIDVQEKS